MGDLIIRTGTDIERRRGIVDIAEIITDFIKKTVRGTSGRALRHRQSALKRLGSRHINVSPKMPHSG